MVSLPVSPVSVSLPTVPLIESLLIRDLVRHILVLSSGNLQVSCRYMSRPWHRQGKSEVKERRKMLPIRSWNDCRIKTRQHPCCAWPDALALQGQIPAMLFWVRVRTADAADSSPLAECTGRLRRCESTSACQGTPPEICTLHGREQGSPTSGRLTNRPYASRHHFADSLDRQPVGRPWVTVSINITTRMVHNAILGRDH